MSFIFYILVVSTLMTSFLSQASPHYHKDSITSFNNDGMISMASNLAQHSTSTLSKIKDNTFKKTLRSTSIVSPSDQEIMLQAHNDARHAVNPPAAYPLQPMVWDEDEAIQAKALADSCVWAHNRAGQNLAAYGNNAFTGSSAESTSYLQPNVSIFKYTCILTAHFIPSLINIVANLAE
jgi:hypothetical protein